MTDEVIILSFDHRTVLRIKEILPALRTGILYFSRPVDALSAARAARANMIAPHWSLLTIEDVKKAHEEKFTVLSWVANKPEEMRFLFRLGIDAIGSNYPDRLVEAIRSEVHPEHP
jgi:glycerophosphoryl diester phosphodiesterase